MSRITRAYELLVDEIKKLRQLPIILLSLPKAIKSIVLRIADRTAILPLSTFSGKTLFIALYLGLIAAAAGLLYNVEGIQEAWVVAWHVGILSTTAFVLFLVSYPLDRAGLIEGFLVRMGVRQRMRLSTRLGALLGGFVVAVVSTVVVEYVAWYWWGTDLGLYTVWTTRELMWPEWQLGAAFGVTFVVGTLLLLAISRRKTRYFIHEGLVILNVLGEGDDREAIIRNDGESVASVSGAKIADAERNIYTLSADLRLRPGEKASITLPDGFVLETELDDSTIDGFYEQHVTSIYSRTGDTYVVRWQE